MASWTHEQPPLGLRRWSPRRLLDAFRLERGEAQPTRRQVLQAGLLGAFTLFQPKTSRPAVTRRVNPQFLLTGGAYPNGNHVHSVLSGRDAGAEVDLIVSREPSGQGTLMGLRQADEDSIVRHDVGGLSPSTTYYAQVVSDGTRVGDIARFKTLPPTTGSWQRKIAVVSCQGQVRSLSGLAWKDIQGWDPDDIWHLGDWGYWGQLIPRHGSYKLDLEQYLRSMRGHPIMRRTIESADLNVVTISDHELTHNGDPKNGIHDSPESIRELVAFQKLFPVRQYGDTRNPRRGRYYSFDIGSTVRVITTDFRTPDRTNLDVLDGPDKTMFGATQLSWLLSTFDPSKLNIIVNETAWLADPNIGPELENSDKPWKYYYEQQVIANYIEEHGLKVAWVGGDRHYVGYLRGTDDGSGVYNTLGGFPCYISSGTMKKSLPLHQGELMTWQFGGGIGDNRWVCGYMQVTLTYDASLRQVTIDGLGRAVLDTTQPRAQWKIEDIPGGTARDTWTLA
jgi:phosphodiesterase/alkaline phosphatase D-like protein